MNPKSDHHSLAIVTGAAGGLGSAVCTVLAQRGWTVLGLDHNTERLSRLASELPEKSLLPVRIELDSDQLAAAVSKRLPAGMPVRALVCTAAQSVGDSITVLSDEDWERSFAVNATSPMVLARLVAPLMMEAGGGAIVNVGSPVGIVGARKPSYAASKAALTGLTMSIARNLGPHGVRANLFLPGPMITPMTQDWSAGKREAIAQGSFLGRLCDPIEAARVIAFLVSPDASYLTGSIVDATAGTMLGH